MARARSRKPLSHERVLAAAAALADEAGLEGLTMRAIGERLGAEAMSLYRHVRDKDDLLDGLVDQVFSEVELPADPRDWKVAMRGRAVSLREALARHPWAIALMESRTHPGPANLRHHDWVLRVLRRAGFDSTMATHAYNVLDSFIYGFALQELNLPFRTAEELAQMGPAMLQQIPADLYPDLADVAAELIASRFDYGKEFDFGLELILDALERTHSAQRVTSTTQKRFPSGPARIT